MGVIQVNFPLDIEKFKDGNGEGIWLEVDDKTQNLYTQNFHGGSFVGEMRNDSLYYPALKWGDTVPFEMRGDKRPVVFYKEFLESKDKLSEDEIEATMEKIWLFRHLRSLSENDKLNDEESQKLVDEVYQDNQSDSGENVIE